jgi:hypothetical protein
MEAAAVQFMRLWHENPDAQSRLRADFAGFLGPEAAERALNALADFCGICARHGRRPFMQHHPACRCLGADEACLANLIGLSTEGDREDALLIATLLVRADFSLHLVAAAQSLGLALRRMLLKAAPDTASARHASLH